METQQDRYLENYQKYLRIWDKYEQQIQYYFEQQDIIKYGSTAKADKFRNFKKNLDYGTNLNKLYISD